MTLLFARPTVLLLATSMLLMREKSGGNLSIRLPRTPKLRAFCILAALHSMTA